MKNTSLILVRHGQSEWYEKNLFTGWENPGLTKKGTDEAKHAGLLASQLLSLFDEALRVRMKKFRDNLHTQVRSKNRKLSNLGPDNYLKND